QSSARSPLGSRWPTAGGLGMACPYPERPCRTLQPEEAAHESAEAFQGAAFCALHSAPHFSYPLGASGCDVWTLARIAGHSSIAISARYVHPSEDTVLAAFSRLSGHNSGHNGLQATVEENGRKLLTREDMYN